MEKNTETLKALIDFYSAETGCGISPRSNGNQKLVAMALEKANNDTGALKTYITQWINTNPQENFKGSLARFEACFTDYVMNAPGQATTSSNPNAPENLTVASSLNIISNAVLEAIKSTSITKIETDIMNSVQTEVRNFIKQEYGTIERKIVTNVDGKKHEVEGVTHEKFEEVLKLVSNDFPVFLTGPAGSGKNVICKQVADALGLRFYFSNAVTQEYKITGFTDAMGKYQPTQFYKAFTEGGVFMLDELDASIPEVLNLLNAALANRYFDFPAPIGFKEAHKDFRVIAAGNTTGHGADYEYVGRNQLDAATLNRFLPVKIDYCKEIEDKVANNDEVLADFCREFRKAAQKVGVSIIISYRNIGALARTIGMLSMDEALKLCMIRDLEKDDLNMIINELSDNKYKRALRKICETM